MMFEDTCNFTALNDIKIMMIFSHYHEAFKNFPHSLRIFFFTLLLYIVLLLDLTFSFLRYCCQNGSVSALF